MNSLVVLLCVVALAFAKPSQLFGGELLTYSAPVIAYPPSAVSTQSRFDIKTSPAVVSTAEYAPLAIRTVIGEPALLAAPAAFAAPAAVSHQSRIDIKTSPAAVSTAALAPLVTRTVIAEPTLLAAPIAIAGPTAVSQQSRFDFKSTPAIAKTVDFSAPVGCNNQFTHCIVKRATINPPNLSAIVKPACLPGVIGAPAALCDTTEVTAARDADIKINPAAIGALLG